MHKSAMLRMQWFIENYIPKDKKVRILDVGSYSVNGNYRQLFRNIDVDYVGLDIENGPNVDVVVKDAYCWNEIKDESFDFVISGNAFEHIEFPWLTMEQIYKKLKPGGFICILAPFRLGEHRYPTDCYRYYPDGLKALAKWARFTVVDATTGGVPDTDDLTEWHTENYDDTVLIAGKQIEAGTIDMLPKFSKEIRSQTIIQGS